MTKSRDEELVTLLQRRNFHLKQAAMHDRQADGIEDEINKLTKEKTDG